jgi:Fe-S-cluster containining protein
VGEGDAEAIAEALSEEFDFGVQRRAEFAAAQGMRMACSAGCNRCCTIAVVVYRPEALRIARWLDRPENSTVREAFLAAYPAWRERMGDDIDKLPALFQDGKQAAYDALHMALWRKGAMCAFNVDGLCSIYPVRPLACKNAHALDTAERCVPDSPDGKPAQAAQFIPLDEFLRKALRLLRATHNAISSQRHHQESVCSAVYKLLQNPGPGGGRKHKRSPV